jgi:ketosteroid isomerase-like protein
MEERTMSDVTHAPTASASTAGRVAALVGLVEQGRWLEAFEEYYAEDVVMQENLELPTVGKAAARRKEERFVGAIRSHESRAASVIVDGDRVAIHWNAEYTFTDGSHMRFDQIAHQLWRDGRIVHERFFYDPGTLQRAA